MSERIHSVKVQRWIDAPPPIVWAFVADSNRVDRALGLAAAHYEYKLLRPDDPSSRARVATAKQYGVELRWVEPPYEWIEGRLLRGWRSFVQGPVSRGSIRVSLTPERGGTQLEAEVQFQGRGFLVATLGSVMRAQNRAGLQRYIAATESMVAHAVSNGATWDPNEPAGSLARRIVAGWQPDGITTQRPSPIDEAELTFRARRFEDAPVLPELRQRLVQYLRERPDEEVTQMRPFEVARSWNQDRRDVLRAFLYAARAGLVDLLWQINCPNCRVASETASALGKVGRTAHCEACNVDFGTDLAEHIEAVFKINGALRDIQPALYCASSPWFRPHVFAQLRGDASGTETLRASLPPGTMLVRELGGGQRAVIEIEPGETPARLEIGVGSGALAVRKAGHAAEGGETEIVLKNDSAVETLLSFERSGWSADIVLGSTITTLPEFVDLFATDAPAAGVDLTVGALTLLFTDLTGSTAMYERLGDAKAFAVVQQHFADMSQAVNNHRGAIVKTMGDAVMANFTSPADALLAAIEMIESTRREHESIGLSVKIGIHNGPCLAVRANERLDFFGTTVNVAARLQAQARASEVVLQASALEHPGIAEIVRQRKIPLRTFETHLKGIRDNQRLVALQIDAPTNAEGSNLTPAAVAD